MFVSKYRRDARRGRETHLRRYDAALRLRYDNVYDRCKKEKRKERRTQENYQSRRTSVYERTTGLTHTVRPIAAAVYKSYTWKKHKSAPGDIPRLIACVRAGDRSRLKPRRSEFCHKAGWHDVLKRRPNSPVGSFAGR